MSAGAISAAGASNHPVGVKTARAEFRTLIVVAASAHGSEVDHMFAMSSAGWLGLGLIGLIIWIALAFWPARVAGRKGHSFFGYFVLSLFFFPLALILAYVVDDRRGLSVSV